MSHMLIQTQDSAVPATLAWGEAPPARWKLSPPYLLCVPRELLAHDAEYRRNEYPLRTRALLHALWLVFRVSYYAGWRTAERATESMPHLQFPYRWRGWR